MEPRKNRDWELAFALLLVFSICYGVAELVPGRFAVTDEAYFKAAGRNWAATGRFAAPELKGFRSRTIPPVTDVFFAYPPLYPFLFGLYTKLVGFGPRSCILYDALIHVLLVWVAFAAARHVFGLPWSAAALCGALFLAVGTVGRPDEMGIVFALAAAIAFRMKARPAVATLLGGILMGFCGLTSLGAAVFLGPLVAWEIVLRQGRLIEKLSHAGSAMLIALAVAVLCVTPLLTSHPGAYRQLFSIAASQTVAGLNNPAHLSSGPTFGGLWAGALLHYGYDRTMLIAVLVASCAVLWWLDTAPDRAEYSRIALALASEIVLVISMPGKYFYLWFAGSWLLLATFALGWRVSRSLQSSRRRLLLAAAAVAWLSLALPYLRWKLILWTLPPEQSLNEGVMTVRNRVPAGAGVLSTDYWWALADRDRVYDSTFSELAPADIDYIVSTGNGSAQVGVPVVRGSYSTWNIVENDLRHSPPTLFGIRLSRSSYGFGAYILKGD